ncbi:hypothetical protein PTSG_08805 [Salpingoeca rosetta]|uniref:Uncharacterized protein n=1 Tax=Salpingoeca rosetta (strain ATCC 50818 / BSB-021) TaxID=946362 RepID=F2UKR3_SALR5|nr:uncharacterized protein PTSG_08805 [Salpingoeca rosetta]EGD77712.1 hypothetical protein PTSG_08805 [Salpingoeca rosetta]|eukprot:XP_004990188.1 hypothetical protein PTSG_08805 [Salpingoeca rosetta]
MQDFVEALDVVAEALQKDDQQHPANSSKAVPPLDPTFGTLLQSIANAAAHDLRKLFVATMKPPVNQDDVKAICAECKNTSVMLVAHCTNALTQSTALHDAMLPLVEAYLNTTRAWVRALIQNNSIGTA